MTTKPATAPPLPVELEELLRRLRLPHIRRHAPEVVATAKAQRWEPAEVLKALFAEEVAGRERSALATRRTAAGFPTGKTFDAWQPDASSIPAPTQQALRTLEWVHRRENLVVCGPSGTGKTFLLEALGQQAVEERLKVAWFTLEDLPRKRGYPQACCCAGTVPTTRCPRPSRGSYAPTSSSLTTSGSCPLPRTQQKGSTGSSTPPTRSGRSRSARTCTPPASTSSCPRPWPQPPSTGCSTMPTSVKPAAKASDKPRHWPAEG